jgi:hypothetical protein
LHEWAGGASALPADDAHLPPGFIAGAAIEKNSSGGAAGARAQFENALNRHPGFGENRAI